MTGSLTVNLPGSGSGTQSFEVDSLNTSTETDITGNLSITMGNANNTVAVQGPDLGIGGNVAITTGSGNQTISVGKLEDLQHLRCQRRWRAGLHHHWHGNSTITVIDTQVEEGSLAIKLGNGNNKVAVGTELDPFPTDVLVDGNLSICAGNGNNTVTVVNSGIEDNLIVQTGNGNATITIGAEVSSRGAY